MAKTKAKTNNTDNVSSAKGVSGGYIFCAPVGTSLPTDIETKLDPAFLVLGFISEDGYVESQSSDSEEITDMNGELIASPRTKRVESAKFTLAEIKADTLKVQYGEDNVKDENGLIAVKHNENQDSVFSYVLELMLKGGRRCRKVVPKGSSSELDDLNIAVKELFARPLTIKYLKDDSGNTCYDYYESTETGE